MQYSSGLLLTGRTLIHWKKFIDAPRKWPHPWGSAVWGATQSTQPLLPGNERADIIQVFKYLKKFSNVDCSKFFALQTSLRTRSNGLLLQARICSTDIGRVFISNQVIRHWNTLPAEVVSGKAINSFNNHIDRYSADRTYTPNCFLILCRHWSDRRVLNQQGGNLATS